MSNIASIAGLVAYPSLGFYSAAKFAVEGLSECLALEAGPLGIRVTLVEPSGFRTNWAGDFREERGPRPRSPITRRRPEAAPAA